MDPSASSQYGNILTVSRGLPHNGTLFYVLSQNSCSSQQLARGFFRGFLVSDLHNGLAELTDRLVDRRSALAEDMDNFPAVAETIQAFMTR